MISDSKTAFSTVAFDSYENAERLIPEEEYLIEQYLDKAGTTLEAGTGGGRILLELKKMGFSSLYGFDYVPRLIQAAKRRDSTNSILFDVQDATCLDYKNSAFDQIIYLAQIISSITEEAARLKALNEAYRVLKPGGKALFSFCSFESRTRQKQHALFVMYLSLFRKLRGSTRTAQYLPWLKPGGRYNVGALLDGGPHFYWFRLEEIAELLSHTGFRTVAVGFSNQVAKQRMHQSWQLCLSEPIEGMLFFVLTK